MRDDGERATAAAVGQAKSPGAGSAGTVVSLADPGGPRTIVRELDDALYYLRHDCVPCAERHFELARRLGAADEMITEMRSRVGERSPE